MCEAFLVMTHWKLNMQNSKLSLVLPVHRDLFTLILRKPHFGSCCQHQERGKPANNSKYNMRRQMLQKSVWQEATMLRSAEVDALLNQTVLVPQSDWSKMPWESNQRKPSSFQSAPLQMPYGVHFVSENNPIHLKHKDGSPATRAPPVILMWCWFF